MADYTFHVLHNARPDYEADVLTILKDGAESTYEEILTSGKAMGLSVGSQVQTERMLKDILQLLRDLGLMERRRIKLTERGRIVAEIASEHIELFPDVMHFLYYSAWSHENEAQNCFSWSYRFACDYLWARTYLVIDNRTLASQLASEASSRFRVSDVSVSTNSINGIMIWLDALSPHVITVDPSSQQRAFRQRPFCPPELLLLSIDLLYREREMDYGTNLLLSDEHRDNICKTCLLDPSGFDRVLDYSVAQFDFLEKGSGGGWGRYLSLRRAPLLKDML